MYSQQRPIITPETISSWCVAREYGKPCVVGIQGITTKLHDGQLVEVDGGSGVIRVVNEKPNN